MKLIKLIKRVWTEIQNERKLEEDAEFYTVYAKTKKLDKDEIDLDYHDNEITFWRKDESGKLIKVRLVSTSPLTVVKHPIYPNTGAFLKDGSLRFING